MAFKIFKVKFTVLLKKVKKSKIGLSYENGDPYVVFLFYANDFNRSLVFAIPFNDVNPMNIAMQNFFMIRHGRFRYYKLDFLSPLINWVSYSIPKRNDFLSFVDSSRVSPSTT